MTVVQNQLPQKGMSKGMVNAGKGKAAGKSAPFPGKGLGKGFSAMPGMDKGKGKKGFDKGKGKGKRGPSGPNLPRTRITDAPVTGEVLEWKGKYGWIQPTVPIEHELAAKREGKVYVSMSDLVGGIMELTPGSLCQFHVFTDASGLGAEECIGS